MSMPQAAFRHVLQQEGGWYDGTQPHDPNPTHYGVTQLTYDRFRRSRSLSLQSVARITMVEVEQIYHDYWDQARCSQYGAHTALTAFDHAINAGPGAAIRCVQRALGVTVDGVVGPLTRAAVSRWDDRALAEAVCWERIREYQRIAASQAQRPNLLSWVRRVLATYDAFPSLVTLSRSSHAVS